MINKRFAIINCVFPVHASPGFPILGLLRTVSSPHLNYAIIKIFMIFMARCPSYRQPVWRISKLGPATSWHHTRQIWLKSSYPLFGLIQHFLLIAAPLRGSSRLVLEVYQSLIHSSSYRFPWLKEPLVPAYVCNCVENIDKFKKRRSFLGIVV